SGLAQYEYCISTAASCGGTVARTWTSTGTTASTTGTGLTLTTATTYFVAVRATDNVGNVSTIANSDGILFDTTTPAPAAVNDGAGADIDYQTSLTTLPANWSAVVDPGSGLAQYEYCISTAASCGGTVVRTWTSTGTTANTTGTGLTLVAGTTYRVAVRATDALGNVSTITTSDGVLIDTSTPAPTTVNDGAGADLDYQTSLTTLPANWSAVVDAGSGLAQYEYCISTAASCGGTVARSWTSTGTTASTTGTGLALTTATTYFVAVRATDNVGNVSTITSSDGILVDTSTPAPATVNDGAGADIDYQTSLTTLPANWSAVVDPGSGLAQYEYCISTAASCGGTVVRTWTSTGTTTSAAGTGLTLLTGTLYRVSVRATDALGNVSTITTSDGVTIDTSTPAPASVNDGAGADLDYQTSLTTLPANWSAVVDGASGLAQYEYCISTAASCGGTVARTWTSTGTTASTTGTGLTLTTATTYFVAVRATDNAGNVSTITSSDGILVDTSTPAPATVNDGAGADIDYQSSTTTLPANWSAVVDPGSGLAQYEYCISTAASCGGTVVRAWTSTGTTASTTGTGLTLSNNTTYFTAVRATDALGNVSAIANSDGVTLDSTPPLAPTLVSPPAGSSAGAWPALVATYLDPAPATPGQLTFEVCSDLACTAVVQSGTSAAGLGTGTNGQWTPTAPNGAYFWHARGTDQSGAAGPWSAVRAFDVGVSSLTLTVLDPSVSLGSFLPSTNATASMSVQVQTSSLNGYNLGVHDTTGATGPACTGGGCGAATVPDWTGTVATPTLWTAGTSGGAGLTVLDATGGRLAKWGTGTGTAATDFVANNFAGLTGTAALAHQRTTYSTGVDTVTFGYRMNVPGSTLGGSYETTVTYTATANP
ncbi:MAG: uncharacterized protein JWL76_962, partial [Thermoleophilia bacterium]|nr:uncharacterized protein [Thermoleophilia bacterium]